MHVWKIWEQQLPVEHQVPRPFTRFQEVTENVELHAFGDASGQGVRAAVYSIVRQPYGTTQQLVSAKSPHYLPAVWTSGNLRHVFLASLWRRTSSSDRTGVYV